MRLFFVDFFLLRRLDLFDLQDGLQRVCIAEVPALVDFADR